jgi:hypothetical protein
MQLSSIRQIPTRRETLFAFEVNGRIHEADIRAMAHTLKSAFDDLGEVDILIIMTGWEGIDVSAVFDSESLSAQAKANRHVRKYAVVGAPRWAEAMINLFSPMTPVEEKTFELSEVEEAWAWVGGNTVEADARSASQRS